MHFVPNCACKDWLEEDPLTVIARFCRTTAKKGVRAIGIGEEFRMLLGEQLRRSRGDACQPLGIQGAQGALFKVTLTSHGYTVVGKGAVLAFVEGSSSRS